MGVDTSSSVTSIYHYVTLFASLFLFEKKLQYKCTYLPNTQSTSLIKVPKPGSLASLRYMEQMSSIYLYLFNSQ